MFKRKNYERYEELIGNLIPNFWGEILYNYEKGMLL